MSHTESIFTQEKHKRFKFPPDSLQLQGGSGSLFCSNCKETDVTYSQLCWKRLIYSKWYWAGSTAPKLNLASAITLFPFICAWEINLRLLRAFFNYRTSHKSPYKTAHKVECGEGRDHLSESEGKTMPRVRIFIISTLGLFKNEPKWIPAFRDQMIWWYILLLSL